MVMGVIGKERLFYPDAMRGLAMYSVVLGHLSMFCFGLYSQALVLQYIGLVLPGLSMFMLISGYLTNPDKVKIKKRLKLLIPFLFFGLLYSYLCTDYDVISFLSDRCKNGYWFLFELVIFNFFVWVIAKTKIKLWLSFGILQVISIICYFLFLRHTLLADIIGLYYWCTYMPFFFVGIWLKRVSIETLNAKKAVVLVGSLCLISVLFVIRILANGSYWPTHIAELLISLPVSIILLLLLYNAENKTKGRIFFGKKMLKTIGSNIGRNTLEIYVLHYFVMYFINLKGFGEYMKENDCLWMEFIVSPFLALFICYVSIGIVILCEKTKITMLFGK